MKNIIALIWLAIAYPLGWLIVYILDFADWLCGKGRHRK